MKQILLGVAVLALSGCSNMIVSTLGPIYDGQDPCQLQNVRGETLEAKLANMPRYCGASDTSIYMVNGEIYTITQMR